MKTRHLISFLFLLIVANSLLLTGQERPATPVASDATLLTLDDAVSIALHNNRLVKNSELEAEKFDFRVKTAQSRRLPQFQFNVLGGELMHSYDFTFDQGAFGTYPGVGSIPSTQTKIRQPARFTTYVTGAFDQPLTQQYKIGLAIRATEFGRQIAKQDVRAERQKIAAEVRGAYFKLVATQAGVDAARQVVTTLEESQHLTLRYVSEKTVLRGDALEVDARLAQARYELSVAENALATQRENLNQLLGRDLSMSFRVDPMLESDTNDLPLDAARGKALESRPEILQARLKEKQAELDRRIAKADYIPDLSLSVRYQGLNDVKVLPAHVGTAGFFLSWEPFDWGRRRNNIAEKARTVEQARNGALEAETKIAVEVGAKYRKWKEAALLLAAARTGHEAAAEQFRVIGNKYKEQAALIRDLLQAQARSTETEFHYQQALSTYWGALAELRQAMGEE